MTRAEEIECEFKKFHAENPHIWEMFVKYTKDLTDAGLQHYSARGVMHRVRWEAGIKSSSDPFKINNDFTPYYARLFMREFPKHDGFFKTRELISKTRMAA